MQQHFILADVQVDSDLNSQEVHGFLSSSGVFAIIFYQPDRARIIAEVTQHPSLHDSTRPSFQDFVQLAKERCPIPLTLHDPKWTSGFSIHARLVDHYRHHRIFLAATVSYSFSRRRTRDEYRNTRRL